MIAMLRGKVWSCETDKIILDVGGVGYLLHVTTGCAGSVKPGEERVFHTYLQVREDDQVLFGFLLKEEKELFLQLLSISGIGPKAALSVLSAFTPKQIRLAIIQEDVSLLTKVPGVGAKTAKRIILELKEKLKDFMETDEGGGELPSAPSPSGSEALETLLALGFSRFEALQALQKVSQDAALSTEDQIKEALRLLAGR